MKRKLDEEADTMPSKRVAASSKKAQASPEPSRRDERLSEFLEASTLPELGPFKPKDRRSRATFYVRECFPHFYDRIMELFERETSRIQGITVVGMPGVGKSTFMAYFFQRYRLETPYANIHVETRKTNLRLKNLCVWEGSRTALTVCKNQDVDVDRLMTLRSADDAIRLIDGCPNAVPQCNRWICFTRSRPEWDDVTDGMSSHERLVLPVWSVAELRDAALALKYDKLLADASDLSLLGEEEDSAIYHGQLRMDQDVVGFAHSIFGGVPLPCLEENVSRMEFKAEALVDLCQNLRDHALGERRLSRRLTLEKTDILLQFFKSKNEGVGAVVQDIGSPYIEQLMRNGFLDPVETDKAKVLEFPYDAPLEQWLKPLFFEVRAHQLLQKGATIKAEVFSLGSRPKKPVFKSFQLDSTRFIRPVATRFRRTILTDGPYYIPTTKSATSIDGLYFNADRGDDLQPRVILFKCATIAKPLPCDGIVQTLKNLDMWDDVQRSPADADGVAIVHVVPVEEAANIKRERFEAVVDLFDESTVDQIQGIGPVAVKMLKTQHQIDTVHQLEACASDATVVVMAKRLMEAHEARVETSGRRIVQILEKIPQFIWGI